MPKRITPSLYETRLKRPCCLLKDTWCSPHTKDLVRVLNGEILPKADIKVLLVSISLCFYQSLVISWVIHLGLLRPV